MVPPGHFAGASYRDDSPRDFGPQIAYACWRWFQAVFRYPCPRQGSEGGRSRPLDHMRQIPFVRRTLVPPHIYIHNVINVSSMWYILRFEHTHAHVLKLI